LDLIKKNIHKSIRLDS